MLPWIVWDNTTDPVPDAFLATPNIVTVRARAYQSECIILSTKRILDRCNEDALWIVDADVVDVVPDAIIDDPDTMSDVIVGPGYARYSRKALERISRDFGQGVDFCGLSVKHLAFD